MKSLILLCIILYSSISFAENKNNINKSAIPDQITLSSCNSNKKIDYKIGNLLKQ